MKASEEILTVWRKFDDFPMETLTKAWLYSKQVNRKQRDVGTMKQHHKEFGVTGNCFDLAIWLLDAFKEAGIEAYPIGSELGTGDDHAAVMAVDREGRRFLCDLGDQWLQPILVDGDDVAYTDEKQAGFFPGAEVQVLPEKDTFKVVYHRPNGKFSTQVYSALPVSMKEFLAAADFSQSHVYPKPLLEVRLPWENETAHWEFCNWKSFLSTSKGLVEDPPLATIDEWVERIHEKTGYDKTLLKESLEYFKGLEESSAS
ncbi:hypothetical protein [Planomicrobium sp. Y74]|uniref:hypothetical protein n=1 Tax=Planomicrobium sp. Y74 TaxID=2478977 RepID=UPI000EF4E042|nr:hypothetical protein [Planomicrobium sp. Y74]RLQ90978.1 hypothetical protein D9754_09345 [Planomicrobium sp. Y74]